MGVGPTTARLPQKEQPKREERPLAKQGGQPPAQLAKRGAAAKVGPKTKEGTFNMPPPAARRNLLPPATQGPPPTGGAIRAEEEKDGNVEATWAQVLSRAAAKARKTETVPPRPPKSGKSGAAPKTESVDKPHIGERRKEEAKRAREKAPRDGGPPPPPGGGGDDGNGRGKRNRWREGPRRTIWATAAAGSTIKKEIKKLIDMLPIVETNMQKTEKKKSYSEAAEKITNDLGKKYIIQDPKKKKLKIKIFDIEKEDCEKEQEFWKKIEEQNGLMKNSIQGKIMQYMLSKVIMLTMVNLTINNRNITINAIKCLDEVVPRKKIALRNKWRDLLAIGLDNGEVLAFEYGHGVEGVQFIEKLFREGVDRLKFVEMLLGLDTVLLNSEFIVHDIDLQRLYKLTKRNRKFKSYRVGHLLLKVSASRMKNDFVHVAPSTGLTVCHSVTPIINDILDYLGANFTQNSRNIMSSTNIPFSRTFLTNLRIAPSVFFTESLYLSRHELEM
ncbi:hypothetical protein G5I_10325 [Acromyrmex echinatior]|uniref:Uncharacterized protein n=1 Tax=Acromyrmex echinatior TaxID=103372 RepID=F4WWL1_ACREC|nr:hypothetical protein G5I_10325 [Acromyrmex echinatior]